jgi:hypothetical protein
MNFFLAIASILLSGSLFTGVGWAKGSLNPSLGFSSSAPHLGVQYHQEKSSSVSAGGYLFHQTSKDKSGVKIVNSMTSLGGQFKLDLLSSGEFTAYLAPGFGVHMIKDIPDMSNSGRTTDVTALGPSFRIGALLKALNNNKFRVGLERFEVWNWMSEETASSIAYSGVVFEFDL